MIRKEETTGFFMLLSRENKPLSCDHKMIFFQDFVITEQKKIVATTGALGFHTRKMMSAVPTYPMMTGTTCPDKSKRIDGFPESSLIT